MDLPATALTITVGALIGMVQGALGAGGAILAIPTLVHILGQSVGSATVTSLVVVGGNAAVGAVSALRSGRLLLRTGIALGSCGIVGAFAGAWVHHQAPEGVILTLFAFVMFVAAASMVVTREGRETMPDVPEAFGIQRVLGIIAVGLMVGFLTGFFGVGGGFLLVPALVSVLAVPMRLAPGTSQVATTMNSIWGLVAYVGSSAIDTDLARTFGGAGIVGVLFGIRIARHVPEIGMRRTFAVVVAAVGLYTLYGAINTPSG